MRLVFLNAVFRQMDKVREPQLLQMSAVIRWGRLIPCNWILQQRPPDEHADEELVLMDYWPKIPG